MFRRSWRSSDSAGRGDGFSLVELLVVMGVIAILLAILLPSLAKAREAARQTMDLSNLRQLAGVCLLYAQDNKGSLPCALPVYAYAGGENYNLFNGDTWWELTTRYGIRRANGSCYSVQELHGRGQGTGSGGTPWMMTPDGSWTAWYDGTDCRRNTMCLGWNYWGGRRDIPLPDGGVYVSPAKAGDPRATSDTLWTCYCLSQPEGLWPSIAPHVGRSARLYSGHLGSSAACRAPDHLGVALRDGSASFVPFGRLVKIPNLNNRDYIYHQPRGR